MGRKSDEAVARDFQSVLERIQLGGTEGAFVDRRVSGTPRRIENRGWRPDRRIGALERRSGTEQRLFASGTAAGAGAPSPSAVTGFVPQTVNQVIAAIRQARNAAGTTPTPVPPAQRVARDFLSWNVGETAQPGPDALQLVTDVRTQGGNVRHILIEAGKAQISRAGTDVNTRVRVTDGFGAPVYGATVRFSGAGQSVVRQTGKDGIAEAPWNVSAGIQKRTAELVGPASATGASPVLGSVEFTAFGL